MININFLILVYLTKGKIFMNGNEIIFLILTLAIGILGGYLADKKKVPAAFMIGALFAVAIFNIFTDRAFYQLHLSLLHR